MAMGYIAMLFLGITGKVPFFQIYSSSIRYGGYLWLYVGIVCYFLFVLGLDSWLLEHNKKIPRKVYYIPPILLLLVQFVRDFVI
mgnify:CR=1 FL=1